MSLIKWEPLDGFDHFLDDRFLSVFSRPSWDLAVDVYEEKGSVVAKMSLPEVKIEDVDISIEDNILTVSGKREEEKEVNEKDYYSKEIRRGSFSRSIRLPKSVDEDKVEAVYKDGALRVSAPVRPNGAENKIKIKVEN